VARMRDDLIPPTLAEPPSDIENLDVVRDYPRLLAAFLVVLGILATVHGLVISTRRRRREMGVLRALGFSRRQVANAVSAHGTTIGIVAVVVGVPLGYAAGRAIWVSQAERIGLATAAPASVLAALAITVGTIALTWAIATAAGARASRIGVGAALRVE
jgi:putative ABC transport system permease protein